MQVLPYLMLEGRCEEAIEFYQEALGAEVCFMMRMGEIPQQPGEEICQGQFVPDPQKISHAHLKIGANELLLSDGMNSGQREFKGITLALTAADEAECRRLFAALAKDGAVQMELGPAFFSPLWGCCADKFGLNWMVMAPSSISGKA